MTIDKKLEALKKIQEVDAPPFLFTRIMQQVQTMDKAPAPAQWKWAFAATAFIILALNLSMHFKTGSTENKTDIESIVSTMKLSDSNELYHE